MDDHELTPEAARRILALQLPQPVIDRVNALAARARDGALTMDERAELDSYEHVGFLLELLKSKARRSLGSGDAP